MSKSKMGDRSQIGQIKYGKENNMKGGTQVSLQAARLHICVSIKQQSPGVTGAASPI